MDFKGLDLNLLVAFDALMEERNVTRAALKAAVSQPAMSAARMKALVAHSLMTVTALAPHIGYEKSAEISQLAEREGTDLKTAALKSGYVTSAQFDDWVDPAKMTGI